MSTTNGNGNKWTFERVLLVVALGGNIGLGGAGFLTGDKQPQQPQVAPTETCEFKLVMCEFKLEELKKEKRK